MKLHVLLSESVSPSWRSRQHVRWQLPCAEALKGLKILGARHTGMLQPGLASRGEPTGTAWLFGAASGLKLEWLERSAGDRARLSDALVTADCEEDDMPPQEDLTRGLFSKQLSSPTILRFLLLYGSLLACCGSAYHGVIIKAMFQRQSTIWRCQAFLCWYSLCADAKVSIHVTSCSLCDGAPMQ